VLPDLLGKNRGAISALGKKDATGEAGYAGADDGDIWHGRNQNPNTVRSKPDCRMIERVVPMGISRRSAGTMTTRPEDGRNSI
jgi:hypothetical protein